MVLRTEKMKYAIYYKLGKPAELALCLSTRTQEDRHLTYEVATSILRSNGYVYYCSDFGLSIYHDLNFVIDVIKLLDEQNGF